MKTFIYTAVGAALLGGVALSAGHAAPFPNGISAAATTQLSLIQDARWVCGPFRCFWRPNFYGAYGFYRPWWGWGPRRGWGWRHRWY
jgi:hypothetical protein